MYDYDESLGIIWLAAALKANFDVFWQTQAAGEATWPVLCGESHICRVAYVHIVAAIK